MAGAVRVVHPRGAHEVVQGTVGETPVALRVPVDRGGRGAKKRHAGNLRVRADPVGRVAFLRCASQGFQPTQDRWVRLPVGLHEGDARGRPTGLPSGNVAQYVRNGAAPTVPLEGTNGTLFDAHVFSTKKIIYFYFFSLMPPVIPAHGKHCARRAKVRFWVGREPAEKTDAVD